MLMFDIWIFIQNCNSVPILNIEMGAKIVLL